MSHSLPSVATVSEAWLHGLEHLVDLPTGRCVHLVTTVTEPGREVPAVRDVLDDFGGGESIQSMHTVAETIFPASLYADPGFAWSTSMPAEKEALLDEAAATLYVAYEDALPLLLTADGNHRGTYFARMITWPGKEAGGINQLAARIQKLRTEHRSGKATYNLLDIDVASDATDTDLRGIQIYAASDRRVRGFPCLTHIDLTLFQGRLHAVAVYRHQYFIEKAYGNMLGLSWLLDFLCQQTGFSLGELVVHATLADDERSAFRGGKVATLARTARAALDATDPSAEASAP